MPFLQRLVRVKLIESPLQLALCRVIARELGAMKARTQSFELVVDLTPPCFKRIGKSEVLAGTQR